MFGVSDQIGPSGITNAMMAAYCTGLVRALLLETLTRLPGEDMGRNGNDRRVPIHLQAA